MQHVHIVGTKFKALTPLPSVAHLLTPNPVGMPPAAVDGDEEEDPFRATSPCPQRADPIIRPANLPVVIQGEDLPIQRNIVKRCLT